jgi:hypothetical protein
MGFPLAFRPQITREVALPTKGPSFCVWVFGEATNNHSQHANTQSTNRNPPRSSHMARRAPSLSGLHFGCPCWGAGCCSAAVPVRRPVLLLST